MKSFIRKIVPKKLLLQYHKIVAIFARFWYGDPSRKLVVIGVTGTDGKTSSVILTSRLLDAAGKVTAYFTTAEFKIAEKKWINETKQTMPGRFQLQKLLKQAVNAGCTHVVVETSSQGIEQFRHLGIQYDVALFTNLSEDHLEAHGSFEQYKAEKMKLFSKTVKDVRKKDTPKVHVINVDDTESQAFVDIGGADSVIGYSVGKEKIVASGYTDLLHARNISLSSDGVQFNVCEKMSNISSEYMITAPLIGMFNVYNVLGVVGVVRALGMSIEEVQKGLESISGIPGRLEVIDEGQNFTVIVDYAHAENALENVFNAIKPLAEGRIISVLGSCGGGRDVKKRPFLGKIAAENADIVIVTNEDPYDEDPQEIIDQVARGVEDAGKIKDMNYFSILDRREAIGLAIKKAEPGDVILLTGKGSEQCIMDKNGKKIPWDDRRVARELINQNVVASNSDKNSN